MDNLSVICCVFNLIWFFSLLLLTLNLDENVIESSWKFMNIDENWWNSDECFMKIHEISWTFLIHDDSGCSSEYGIQKLCSWLMLKWQRGFSWSLVNLWWNLKKNSWIFLNFFACHFYIKNVHELSWTFTKAHHPLSGYM